MTSLRNSDDVREISEVINHLSESFLKWLTVEISKSDIELLLFVSRDGYWFHQNSKKPNSNFSSDLMTSYFFASRASLYELVRKAQMGVLIEPDLYYLRTCFMGAKSIGMVDLGWSGTSIQMIRNLFPELKLTGFYFGTHRNSNSNIRSYLGQIRVRKYFGLTEILETIFSAPHQSVMRVSGTSNSPAPEYFESDKKLLSLQSAIKRYNSEMQPRDSVAWSKIRVQFELTKLCFFPSDKIFDNLYEISHSVKGEMADGLALGQYNFPRFGTKALAPFWSLKSILISDQSLLQKSKSGTWFLLGQAKFVFSYLIKSARKRFRTVSRYFLPIN